MRIDVHGRPLHARSLTVTLTQGEEGRLDVEATLLDLRKTGLVPVAGKLGTPGILHLMRLRAPLDPRSMTLGEISVEQPTVAFEPSRLTAGESCRDPNGTVSGLAGIRLDEDYAKRLGAEIGGARGCSHILTLAHFLGSAVIWALGPGGARAEEPQRRIGERVFRRDVVVDGLRAAPGQVDIAVQLTDLCFASAAPIARPMDHFASMREVHAQAAVDLDGTKFASFSAAERYRTRDNLEQADWSDLGERVRDLVGLSPFRGVTGELMSRLGSRRSDRPLLDALLMVAPAFIQVCGVLSDSWPAEAARSDSIIGMGGLPDSCYMWRRGGPLDKARKEGDRAPVRGPRRGGGRS